MVYLALGILLWIGAHLSTTLRMGFRQALIEKLGANKYKGLFSLVILTALGLIVLGWKSAEFSHIYDPPLWNSPLMVLFMAIAVFLFVVARAPSNVKRFIRHPQLSGVIVWALAHLLANGDNRSVLLFGGLGLWALAEIILINRREGEWVKPDSVPFYRDAIAAVIALVVVGVLMGLHPYFTGMAITFGS